MGRRDAQTPTNGEGKASEDESQKLLEEASRLLDLGRELQESASSLISKTRNEEQSLCHRAVGLGVRSSKPAVITKNLDRRVSDKLCRVRRLISDGDLASLLPSRTNGGLLRAFLGPVDVHARTKDVRFKVKEEYNNSRVVVCGVLLVLMAMGNFAITVETLLAKSRFKAKMKRGKSKLEYDQIASLGIQ